MVATHRHSWNSKVFFLFSLLTLLAAFSDQAPSIKDNNRLHLAGSSNCEMIIQWIISTSNVALSHRYVCTQPWQGGIWLILGVNSSVLEFAKVPCERLVLPHPQSLDYSRVGNHVFVIYVVFFLEYHCTIILSINRKYSHAAILMQSQVKKNRLPTNTASSKKTQKLLNKNMSIYSIINTHLHSITQM